MANQISQISSTSRHFFQTLDVSGTDQSIEDYVRTRHISSHGNNNFMDDHPSKFCSCRNRYNILIKLAELNRIKLQYRQHAEYDRRVYVPAENDNNRSRCSDEYLGNIMSVFSRANSFIERISDEIKSVTFDYTQFYPGEIQSECLTVWNFDSAYFQARNIFKFDQELQRHPTYRPIYLD